VFYTYQHICINIFRGTGEQVLFGHIKHERHFILKQLKQNKCLGFCTDLKLMIFTYHSDSGKAWGKCGKVGGLTGFPHPQPPTHGISLCTDLHDIMSLLLLLLLLSVFMTSIMFMSV